MNIKTRFIWLGLLSYFLLNASAVKAGQCSATFADGVTSYSGTGTITFGKNSMITGNPDTVLAAANVDSSSQGASCQSADCTAGGSTAASLTLGSFQSTSSSTEVIIAKNGSGSIGNSGTNNYKLVKVEQGASLSVSSSYSTYKIKELNIGKNAVATFPPGEYWIEKLVTDQGMSINVSGSGTVKFYIFEDTTIGKNSQTNASGSTSSLFIYTYNKFITNQGANVKGYVYVSTDATLGKNSLLSGSLSATNIDFGQGAQVAFDSASITNTDFGSTCTNTPEVIHHFEITHDGAGSTCATDSITVKACSNADCSSTYSQSITADFQGDGNTKKALSFTGSTTFNLAHSTAETLTLSIANASKSAENALVCSSGGGNSCDMVFSSASCPAAGACAATYIDGLTNSDAAGSIKFQNTAYLTGNGDTILASASVLNNGSGTTCVTANCSAGGSASVVTPISATFSTYTSGTDITVETNYTIDAADYRDVVVQNGGVLNMDSNELLYKFRKLTVKNTSTLNMTPGDYYVEELVLQDSSTLNIVGNGTVRIYAKNKAQFKNSAVINGGSSGDASKLILYFFAAADNKVKVHSGAQFTGFIYSQNQVEVKSSCRVYGGISAAGEIVIKESAIVTARTSSASSVNFGSNMSCVAVGSQQCSATFPDALSSSDAAGYVKFQNTARVIDNPDTVLATPSVLNNGSATTCTSANCTASGSTVPQLKGSFTANTSATNLTVNGSTQTIASNDYQDITVKGGGTLNMSGSFSSYTFNKLKVQASSTVNFTAGDYYINDLEIKGTSNLNVIGTGTVRIWSQIKAKFKESSVINGGSSGDAAKFFLYYYASSGDDRIKVESGASVAGFLYSANKVEVKGASTVYGAISAVGELKIKDSATVTYKSTALNSADFGGACQSSSTPSVDHYRFEYDGSALTCAAESITVKACANSDCSTLSTDASSLTFGVSTTEPSSVNLNLNFTGSTVVTLAESAPTTLTLSASGASPGASLQCYQNSTLDGACDYTTTDTGFIILNETDANQVIPTQIAGKPSNSGYNSKNIVLQAVQTDVNTGSCAPLFGNGSTVAVDLAFQCVDPNSCNGSAATITNNGNTYTLSEYTSYSTHNLLFAADSKASIAITYPNVGKIKLYAKKSVVIPDDVPGDTIKTLTGNTNDFVVKPFGFYMSLSDSNPAATDAGGGAFGVAGQPFGVTLSARAWASGEDTNNDGVPDSHADLSNNTITTNFGQESTSEGVTVTPNLVHPSGGVNPALGNNTFTSFTNGSQTRSGASGLTWGDVGIITMTASGDANYMDSGLTTTTTSGNVGRFVPSHFKLKNPSVTEACANGYSYMGQSFSVGFNLYAYGVGDITLNNYDSGVGNGFHGLATIGLVAENNDSGNGTVMSSRLSNLSLNGDGRWVNGLYAVNVSPTFERGSSIDGPFDNTLIGLQVNDGDSSAAINLLDNSGTGTNMNAATSGACVIGTSCDAMQINGTEAKFRYGRMNSDQVFGPATSALVLPLYAEYFDGSRFVPNLLDSCSSLNANDVNISGSAVTPFASSYNVLSIQDGSNVGTTTVDTSPTNTSSTTLVSSSGEFNLTLTTPVFASGQSSGYVPVFIDLTNYPWLQFDWDTNGTGTVETTLPTQNITFGQFRGNDRVIFWREKR